jgi:pimeloyl-ACP methyl ester carboxylesterase
MIIAFLFIMSVPFSHAEDFFFDSDRIRIHYTIEGKRDSVGSEPPTPEDMEEMNKWFLPNNDQLALAALIRGSDNSRLVTDDHLRANKVPVLALIGEKDLQKANMDVMTGLMSNLEILVIPKADHITALSDVLFIQGLISFLSKHPIAVSGIK